MCAAARAPDASGEVVGAVRRRRVPTRAAAHVVVVARPSDGAAVELEPTAAFVWAQLEDWITPTEIDARLAAEFPDVADTTRVEARAQILRELWDDGLVERR